MFCVSRSDATANDGSMPSSTSTRMDFGPSVSAWDAVMDDLLQQQKQHLAEPAVGTITEGAEELIAAARVSGTAAAVKDINAAAAVAVLSTVGAKAAAINAPLGCPSRILSAVMRASDRIQQLEVLLADVLERAVRSESEADEAVERSALTMQVCKGL